MSLEAQRAVQEAIGEYCDDGEIVVKWVIVAEIIDKDGKRLMHRAGGGDEGGDPPTAWEALGMLQSSTRLAEDQSVEWSQDPPKEE